MLDAFALGVLAERRSLIDALADRYSAAISLQGWIADSTRLWRITTGYGGLGTSGSGDVLAGAIAGLLARGAEPVQAACWGTHLHAVSGDRLISEVGPLGYLARELADCLPRALAELER